MRFEFIAAVSILMLSAAHISAGVTTRTVEYKQGDTTYEGYLAWDDSSAAKRPAVIVVHEWWGSTSYPKHRALQLAELGYVGFAIDMFGKGKTTDDPKQAGEWATEVKKDPTVEKARFEAAFDALKKQPMVDPEKIAVIGYCFGGTVALDTARMGEPVKGVVSFHGDLSSSVTPPQNIAAKILVLNGGADKFVPAEQIKAFEAEMKKAGADYKLISYPGAHHAFTNPDADKHKLDNIQYNAEADKKSWDAMKDFLANLFKQ